MERLGPTLAVTAAIALGLLAAEHILYPYDPSSTAQARAAQAEADDPVATTGSTTPTKVPAERTYSPRK